MMRRFTSGPKPWLRVFSYISREIARAFRAEPISDAVVARKVRAGFGRRDDVIGRDRVRRVRQVDVDELGAARAQNIERAVETAADRRLHALFEHLSRHAESHAADIARERANIVGDRFLRCRRIVRVGTCEHRQRDGSVMGRARHWPDLIERRGKRDEAVSRHAPIRRLQADDTAERRRLPDGAAGIRAKRDRRHACGHCDGRSAARPAGDVIGIPWIARRSECGVLGRRAHGEFVAIRLAHHDSAGRLEPRRRRLRRRVARTAAAFVDAAVVVMPRVMMLSLSATGTPASGPVCVFAIDRSGAVERTLARDGRGTRSAWG